jgi:hypothetical protein
MKVNRSQIKAGAIVSEHVGIFTGVQVTLTEMSCDFYPAKGKSGWYLQTHGDCSLSNSYIRVLIPRLFHAIYVAYVLQWHGYVTQ